MEKTTLTIFVLTSTGVVALLAATLFFFMWRARGPKVERAGSRRRSGHTHRSYLAAAAVAPGALLLGWAAAIVALGMPTGLVLGWIPAAGIAATLAGTAHAIVNIARPQRRTAVVLTIGIACNVAYAVALWIFMQSSR